MMMQPAMVNPYASATKTAEIMSRYKPIAPKPIDGGGGGSAVQGCGSGDGMSEKIQQSPYLRNLWPKLQARPTRTRKRGRMIGVSVSPVAFKRTSPPQPSAAAFLGLPPPPPPHYYAVGNGWFGRGFGTAGSAEKIVSLPVQAAVPVTLPLLPTSPASSASPERSVEKGVKIDLKSMVEMTPEEESDLTLQLRGPASSGSVNVISPRPIRPVGSCITITALTPAAVNAIVTKMKTPKEVEADIEADEEPAIVTDSRNRVRLTNSSYNEMVGQPQCMWLGGRIGGEVVINFNSTTAATNAMDRGVGFKGWVQIEWGSRSAKETCKKAAIEASCNVERLRCVCPTTTFSHGGLGPFESRRWRRRD